jgi:hypothetical protein
VITDISTPIPFLRLRTHFDDPRSPPFKSFPATAFDVAATLPYYTRQLPVPSGRSTIVLALPTFPPPFDTPPPPPFDTPPPPPFDTRLRERLPAKSFVPMPIVYFSLLTNHVFAYLESILLTIGDTSCNTTGTATTAAAQDDGYTVTALCSDLHVISTTADIPRALPALRTSNSLTRVFAQDLNHSESTPRRTRPSRARSQSPSTRYVSFLLKVLCVK